MYSNFNIADVVVHDYHPSPHLIYKVLEIPHRFVMCEYRKEKREKRKQSNAENLQASGLETRNCNQTFFFFLPHLKCDMKTKQKYTFSN